MKLSRQEIRALIVGLLLGLCFMTFIAAGTGGEVGRYQIISGVASQQNRLFVMDTKTGDTFSVYVAGSTPSWRSVGNPAMAEEK